MQCKFFKECGMNASASDPAPSHGLCSAPQRLMRQGIALLNRIPGALIALLGRFSIAAIF